MPTPVPHVSINSDLEDIEQLRTAVQNAINSLIDRINANATPKTVDVAHNRISNVAWPVSRRDAVNVEYLQDALKKIRRISFEEETDRDWWHTIEDYDPSGDGAALSTITDGYTNPAVEVKPGERLQLLEWVATLKTPPGTGGSLVCDVLYSTNSGTAWASIFSTSSYPTFDAGEVIVSGTSFVQTVLPRHAILRGDIRVADGTAADLNLQLYGRKVPA